MSFTQGPTPSEVAEPSFRHRSTLSKSPLPKALSFPVVPFGNSHILLQTCQSGPQKYACLWLPLHGHILSFWNPLNSLLFFQTLDISLIWKHLILLYSWFKKMCENIKPRILYNQWASHNDSSGRVYIFSFDSVQAWSEVYPVKSEYHSISRITTFMESLSMTCSFKIRKTLNLNIT